MRLLLLFGALGSLVIASCIGESPTVPTTNCDEPSQFCGNACTNTQTDPRNCGGCGKVCNVAAGETCQKGTCGPPCTGGTTRCGTVCLDVQSDPQNCGDCGVKCGPGEFCSSGKCSISCRSGLNACQVMGTPLPADAGTSDAAPPGTRNVCVDFQSDSDHCGKCGNKCPQDKPFCDFGQCRLYKWSGILTNVNQDDLSPRWTECFTESYSASTTIATILSKCPQANLMLACRPLMTKTLTVAAEAPRADVLFDTGAGTGTVGNFHLANGTAWYFNATYSWGFAVPLDGLTHFSCDVSQGNYPEKRLCWHMSSGTSPGYRCGTNINPGAGYERVIFQTP